MILAMLIRMLRLSERLGRLVVLGLAWAGQQFSTWLWESRRWFGDRLSDPLLPTDSARTESQVSSLSGLVVALLLAVVGLIFWSTNPQAQTSPVVRFLAIGPTPSPATPTPPQPSAVEVSGTTFLGMGGTVVFSMFSGAQRDLYALTTGQSAPVRLTASLADDRDPAWSPDGQRIAFASRRDGNWEIYILDVLSGAVTRLTYDLAFEAAPSWSPDGQWLAYEGYYDGNLDIYLIRADGSEGPLPVTRNPGPDFAPAWGPGGRELAYVSVRRGSQDIYLISLDDPDEQKAINLTNTPDIDETHPAWSPDGKLIAYSSRENGILLVSAVPLPSTNLPAAVVGQGTDPAWSPDGSGLIFVAPRADGSLLLTGKLATWETSSRAFALQAPAAGPSWSGAILPTTLRGTLAEAMEAPIVPAFEETLIVEPQPGEEAPYRLVNLQPLGVTAESPYLSDRVDASFSALRAHISRAAGWDFLGQMDSVLWDLERRVEPGQDYQNWHKAGRAFDILQAYNFSNPAQIELVPEPTEADLFWRLYVRCAIQDGSLGEPLRSRPWDFAARTSGDVEAYENGGRFKDSIPPGYYVDFTEIAQLYGWQPVAAGISWRSNWPAVLYWQYEKRDGLDWWKAMLELYPQAVLEEALGMSATDAPSQAGAPAPPEPTPAVGN